jgi:16S rRNA (uracil1498-N3)-methyltransferase
MMTSPRFYCPAPLTAHSRLALPDAVARHAIRVLRLREGDQLTLFDGRGGEYGARLVALGKDSASVEIGEWRQIEREAALALTLIQAVQAAEKMDLTLQKAVELGVSRFVPVESRRSVVRLSGERAEKRVEHWRGVAVAACEQCGRNRLPEVAALQSVEAALVALGACTEHGLRLLLSPLAELTLPQLPPPTSVTLLIGAEGGLDEREEQAAKLAGFIPVRLGPRVLRTETAGLTALAAIHALWGDFRK